MHRGHGPIKRSINQKNTSKHKVGRDCIGSSRRGKKVQTPKNDMMEHFNREPLCEENQEYINEMNDKISTTMKNALQSAALMKRKIRILKCWIKT